jgi:hypothetical protein
MWASSTANIPVRVSVRVSVGVRVKVIVTPLRGHVGLVYSQYTY